MMPFSSLSIKNKITLIVLLVTAFSLITGLSFVIVRDIKTFKDDMRENFVGLARVIADYSVVDLAFADQRASADTLTKLATVSNIDAVFLFDSEGKLFSSYIRDGLNLEPPPLRNSSVEFGPDALHIYQPVTDQDIFYGTLYLRISTSLLDQKIKQHILMLLILLCGLILISAGIAIPLQSIISTPILDLAETARKISEKGDYSIRVNKRSDDEIGVLCEGFNNMLSQIESKQQNQMKAESALRESEDRYRGVVESSPEAIFVEQDGHIVFINSAGFKMLGYSSLEDMHGISFKNLFAGEEIELTLNENELSTVPVEGQFKRKDGSVFDVELSFIRTVFQGKPALQFLARDVTETRNFQRTAQRMERLASIGEFAATIAHEIRNSLGSISLNFRYISDRMTIPEPFIGKFHSIEKGIERIQDVIRGILDFSRPAPPDLKKASLHQIIDSSILTVEKEIQDAKIQVKKEFAPGIPELMVDPTQISQVFVNLFLNAIQAMKNGGGLTIKTACENGAVQVMIEDTGAGIEREHLMRIYDPFFTTRPEGVGLGLAVVVRTLEQHGAKITAESKIASGTRFVIHFPLDSNKKINGMKE